MLTDVRGRETLTECFHTGLGAVLSGLPAHFLQQQRNRILTKPQERCNLLCCPELQEATTADIPVPAAASAAVLQVGSLLTLLLFQLHLMRRASETKFLLHYPSGAVMHGVAYLFGLR